MLYSSPRSPIGTLNKQIYINVNNYIYIYMYAYISLTALLSSSMYDEKCLFYILFRRKQPEKKLSHLGRTSTSTPIHELKPETIPLTQYDEGM